MQLITPYSDDDRATPSVFTSVTHCRRENGGTSVDSIVSERRPRDTEDASSGLRVEVSRSIRTESSSICEPIAVTRGGVASVSVHPREVFCEAIRWRAHAVIVAHNHPCGDATPSEKDIVLTENLLEAARVLRIPFLDHLVLANDTFTSIKNLGRISLALN